MWTLCPFFLVLRIFVCNTDTSVMWTLGSVSLVSVLRRVDCKTNTCVMWTLNPFGGCIKEVSHRHLCNVDTPPFGGCNVDTQSLWWLYLGGLTVTQTPVLHIESGHSIPLVSVLRRIDCSVETCVMWTLCPFGVCIKKVCPQYRNFCYVDTLSLWCFY